MRIYLTIISLFIFVVLHSQSDNQKKQFFQNQLNLVNNEYQSDDKVVQEKLLNKRLTKAFNQIIFSSSDLVNNASAFGVSQNEEKTNVSVNTNFHLYGTSQYQLFLKGGINANGSGSIFNLYSREEWRNSVGANAGLIWKFRGSGFTNEGKNKLKQDKVLRELFIRDSIMNNLVGFKKGDYKKELNAYTQALKNQDKSNIEKHYKNLDVIESFFKEIEGYGTKDGKKLNFKDYSDSTQNNTNEQIIDNLIDLIWSNSIEGNKALKSVIENIAYEYDKKYIKNTGYSFWWLDANIKLNNNTFNFSEKASNIEGDILTDFNALDAEKTGINKLNTVLSANFNYAHNSLLGSIYIQTGTRFNSGSFLNNNLIIGTAKVSRVNQNGLFFIEDEEGQTLGDFNSIDRDLQYGSFDLYGAYFFGKKKIFGLNLSFNHRYKIKTPQNSFYENNYSILFGPIFRKPKDDDDTGLTFGIDVGFDNAIYNTRASDNFVARIRVGIPFKLYNINK